MAGACYDAISKTCVGRNAGSRESASVRLRLRDGESEGERIKGEDVRLLNTDSAGMPVLITVRFT